MSGKSDDWEEHRDEASGASYMWNKKTGESRWIVDGDGEAAAIDREMSRIAAEELAASQHRCKQLRSTNRRLSSELRLFQLQHAKREAFHRLKAQAFPAGAPELLRADGGEDTSFAAGSIFGVVAGVCLAATFSSLALGESGPGAAAGRPVRAPATAGGSRPRGFGGFGGGPGGQPVFSSHAMMVELVAYTTHIHLPFLLYVFTHNAALTLLAVYLAETAEWLNNALQLVNTHTFDDPLEDVVLGALGLLWGVAFVWAWQLPRAFPFRAPRDSLTFVGFGAVYGVGCSLTMSLAWSWPKRFGLSVYTAWCSGMLLPLRGSHALPLHVRDAMPVLCIVSWAFGTCFAASVRDGPTRTAAIATTAALSIVAAFAAGPVPRPAARKQPHAAGGAAPSSP
eukprot:g4690.t1